MEHWCNITDKGKLKYSDKELPHCHMPSKMLHGMVSYRNQSYSVRGLRITTRANFKTNLHYITWIWSIWIETSCKICGNKMPTRYNRGFYCRSYCLLNMFRAPLCPSSGAQECYTVAAACGISCCGFQVAGQVWSWGLCVRFGSILQTGHITLSNHCIILLSSWWWA